MEDKQESNPTKDEKTKEVNEAPPKIDFVCSACLMNEKCDYKGRNPHFARKINLTEECFVMKDPFSPPVGTNPGENFLIIGADCSCCGKIVCRGFECSFFYYQTFCLDCVRIKIKKFPIEIQSKIKKQLVAASD